MGLGSMGLLTLYFFMKYAIYFIKFSFCFGGALAVAQLVGAILGHFIPSWRRQLCTVPEVGVVTVADIPGLVVGVSLVIGWLLFRATSYGWIFQDLVGVGFLCMLQRSLRLPNLKVATLLLSIMFFFDIFWVFLSPMIFNKSVMIEVAKGAGTGEQVPMLMRIPAVSDPYGGERMLGFGDIALPGLMVSYLLKFDRAKRLSFSSGYFVPGLVGYLAGLSAAMVALALTHAGQPALLYLVPGILTPIHVLGRCRGDFGDLWEGLDPPDDASVKNNGGDKTAPVVAELGDVRAVQRTRRSQQEDVDPEAVGCLEEEFS